VADRLLYVVDGYNVLHALYPGLEKDDLADKRQWLIDQLASLAAARSASVTLVFDARGRQGSTSQPVKGAAVEVVFAGGRLGADTLIARRIADQPADVTAIVVSADQEVQRAAARAGVSRMTPRELGLEMNSLATELALSPDMSTMRSTLEDKVDVETLRRLEEMRTKHD
jgi:predicted RNA-binding protein with PIN domain